jgi:tRNA (guanine-N7-)-methyltransferase
LTGSAAAPDSTGDDGTEVDDTGEAGTAGASGQADAVGQAEPPNSLRDRPIRSFVLRQGRITQAQQRAIDSLLPRFGIPWSTAPLDPRAVFGRVAPLIVEIGFGMGEGTAQIAAAHPGNDYLGIEVHNPGVGSLLDKIGRAGLTNVRIVQHDAVEVLRTMIAPASLAGAHVFFPDPWHKKRHHKRRLLQAPFVSLLASRLAPGGYLHVATDWEDYARQILAVLSAEPLLENSVEEYAPRPDYRPLTRFEQRGVRLGHAVFDLVFTRRR